MFALRSPDSLRPYYLGANDAPRWRAYGGDGLRFDPLDEAGAPFALALNRANCLAHDGQTTPAARADALGMPRWVMLDCCLLPSAAVGFAVPRAELPKELADELDPDGRCDWMPVAEYIALPAARGDTVVGVSLFTLSRGRGLGRRAKALGLHVAGVARQIGIAQYSNPALRVHLAFGALEVRSPSVAVHSRPDETFVYELDVPDPSALAAVAGGEQRRAVDALPDAEGWFDPREPTERAAFVRRATEQPVSLVATGPVEGGKLTAVGWSARPRAAS